MRYTWPASVLSLRDSSAFSTILSNSSLLSRSNSSTRSSAVLRRASASFDLGMRIHPRSGKDRNSVRVDTGFS